MDSVSHYILLTYLLTIILNYIELSKSLQVAIDTKVKNALYPSAVVIKQTLDAIKNNDPFIIAFPNANQEAEVAVRNITNTFKGLTPEQLDNHIEGALGMLQTLSANPKKKKIKQQREDLAPLVGDNVKRVIMKTQLFDPSPSKGKQKPAKKSKKRYDDTEEEEEDNDAAPEDDEELYFPNKRTAINEYKSSVPPSTTQPVSNASSSVPPLSPTTQQVSNASSVPPSTTTQPVSNDASSSVPPLSPTTQQVSNASSVPPSTTTQPVSNASSSVPPLSLTTVQSVTNYAPHDEMEQVPPIGSSSSASSLPPFFSPTTTQPFSNDASSVPPSAPIALPTPTTQQEILQLPRPSFSFVSSVPADSASEGMFDLLEDEITENSSSSSSNDQNKIDTVIQDLSNFVLPLQCCPNDHDQQIFYIDPLFDINCLYDLCYKFSTSNVTNEMKLEKLFENYMRVNWPFVMSVVNPSSDFYHLTKADGFCYYNICIQMLYKWKFLFEEGYLLGRNEVCEHQFPLNCIEGCELLWKELECLRSQDDEKNPFIKDMKDLVKRTIEFLTNCGSVTRPPFTAQHYNTWGNTSSLGYLFLHRAHVPFMFFNTATLGSQYRTKDRATLVRWKDSGNIYHEEHQKRSGGNHVTMKDLTNIFDNQYNEFAIIYEKDHFYQLDVPKQILQRLEEGFGTYCHNVFHYLKGKKFMKDFNWAKFMKYEPAFLPAKPYPFGDGHRHKRKLVDNIINLIDDNRKKVKPTIVQAKEVSNEAFQAGKSEKEEGAVSNEASEALKGTGKKEASMEEVSKPGGETEENVSEVFKKKEQIQKQFRDAMQKTFDDYLTLIHNQEQDIEEHVIRAMLVVGGFDFLDGVRIDTLTNRNPNRTTTM